MTRRVLFATLLLPTLGAAPPATDWWIEYVPTSAVPQPLGYRRVNPDSLVAVVVDRRPGMDSVRLHVWRGGGVVDLGAVPCGRPSGSALEQWVKSRPDRWVAMRPYLAGYVAPDRAQGYVDLTKVGTIRLDGQTADGKDVWRVEGVGVPSAGPPPMPGAAVPLGGIVEGWDRIRTRLGASAPR
jgi:hypothetical protein